MMRALPKQRFTHWVVSTVLMFIIMGAPKAHACATCFGESDSPLAAGVSWGILTMIVVAYSVLFSIIGFFIFVARRAAATAAAEAQLTAKAEPGVVETDHNELCSKNS